MGGILAGISMIIYAFSGSFLMALTIDVLAVGIASNLYFVAQRALIPDLVDIRHRGRANGIVNVFSILGTGLAGLVFVIFLNERFGVPYGDGTIITPQGYIFALSLGGLLFIICGIIGFLYIREKKADQLPPKKAFRQELRELFDREEYRRNGEFYKFVIANTIFY
jgi:MFS family permease